MDRIPDLSGRTAVITGASRGIGAAAAEHLARHGAHVVIVCPSPAHGRAAVDVLHHRVPRTRAASVVCDLADLAQVRTAAAHISTLVGQRLDILINNAGVAALPPARSADGHEMHFAVNHLGHFALTGHLLPTLLNAPEPRVVNVSSVLHWLGRCSTNQPFLSRPYHRWLAYFDSKLATLQFTQGLVTWAAARALPLTTAAAHPGLADTTLGSSALTADGRHLEARLLRWMQARWHTPAQAAWPLVRAATDPHVTTGEFLGPGGRWEWSGPPVRVRAARRAHDPEAVLRLWHLSQRLTGHPFPTSSPKGRDAHT
ncbi:SDR family NAD(P)-dependent oxidoreductase OS=Streptomyces tendae OX=1932 GN=GUR47_09945 PE=3 SV=1 [Streptomyces tendae]